MTDPVQIVPFGRADVQSYRWAHDGQDRITLVARSTFDVRDDETMTLVDPEPLRGADLAPYRDRTDVLVFGDPARHGERVPVSIHDGATPVLDGTARVFADRGARAIAPEAIAVPEDVDWSAYQEAPAEQQTALLRGGERLVAGPLRGRVPRARGVVYVADAGAPKEVGDRIDMDLDAVHVDLDRRVCSLVYRSVFLLDAADELDGRALHVGIEPGDEDEEAANDLTADAAQRDTASAGALDREAWSDDAPDAAHPATHRAPFAPSLGDAPWALAGRTATSDPLDGTPGRIDRATGASQPMMATTSFTSSGPEAERGVPAPAGGASAMSSEDQPGVRVKRSKPATAAPTPPGTAGVRRALYERFRP